MWGEPREVPEDESHLWAVAEQLPLRQHGGPGGGGNASDDEAEAEDLPAYQFRMGLGEI